MIHELYKTKLSQQKADARQHLLFLDHQKNNFMIDFNTLQIS